MKASEKDRLYRILENKICERIFRGEYADGENLPPERTLAESLGVSRVTVRKALALLEADVNYKVAKDFCAQVSERAMGQEVMESLTPAQQVVKIVNEELVALMGGEEAPRLVIKNKGQTIIMLCGLQGNGKTTHAAKLAKYYIK